MPLSIIKQIEKIISPVYLVGGSVRDVILGYQPKDYDFATPLSPDEIESKVRQAGKKPYLTGKRFGTIGMKLGEHLVEITTFRTEKYGKTRKPSVKFVEHIDEDLGRRDFTINAMARRDHHIIDPFGGRDDLKNELVRCVGNPALRFNEDPLRMLRAARFAAQFNFKVEENTKHAITKHGYKILRVSHERWMQELDKIIVAPYATVGLNILAETDLIKYLIPEMRIQVGYDQNSPWHDLSLWDHSVATLQKTENDLELRWAALLHDIGKPFTRVNKPNRSIYFHHDLIGEQLIMGIGRRLKWSNERTHNIAKLVGEHMTDDLSPISEADQASKHK